MPEIDSKPVLLASIPTARLRMRDAALIRAGMARNPACILVASRLTRLAGSLAFARLASILLARCLTRLASLTRSLALTCLTGVLALTRLARLACLLLACRLTGCARLVVGASMARRARVAAAGNTSLARLGRTLAIRLYRLGLLVFPCISGSIHSFAWHAGRTPTGCPQADVEIEFIVDFSGGCKCRAGQNPCRLANRNPGPPERAERRVDGR
jgi:hypothetical protein